MKPALGEEQKQRIFDLFTKGVSVKEIAEKMNIHPQTAFRLIRLWRRLDLHPRELNRLNETDKKFREIFLKNDNMVNTKRRINRKKRRKKHRKVTPEMAEEMEQMFLAGKSGTRIARKFRVSQATVSAYLKNRKKEGSVHVGTSKGLENVTDVNDAEEDLRMRLESMRGAWDLTRIKLIKAQNEVERLRNILYQNMSYWVSEESERRKELTEKGSMNVRSN